MSKKITEETKIKGLYRKDVKCEDVTGAELNNQRSSVTAAPDTHKKW